MTLQCCGSISAIVGAIFGLAATATQAAPFTYLAPGYSAELYAGQASADALEFVGNTLWRAGGNSFFSVDPVATTVEGGNTVHVTNGPFNMNVPTVDMVADQGRLYNVNGFELNLGSMTGTRRWVDCGASHAIARDPRDGAIFVGSVGSGKIWRIPNPSVSVGIYNTNCAADLYFDAGAAGLGGITDLDILPDGTLVAAGFTNNRFLMISPYSPVTPQGTLITSKPLVNSSPVSIASAYGDVYIGTSAGSIIRINLNSPVYAETLIASGAGYIHNATVGPDGSIYFAAAPQVVGFLPASVIRLSEILPPPPPDETPGPGALWLLGPGGRWCS